LEVEEQMKGVQKQQKVPLRLVIVIELKSIDHDHGTDEPHRLTVLQLPHHRQDE
jgi:hypothetical protein